MAVPHIALPLTADNPAGLTALYRIVLGLVPEMAPGLSDPKRQLSLASEDSGGPAFSGIPVEVGDLAAVLTRAGAAVVHGPVDKDEGI